ncbi:MAG: HEAT repeat domain-containing protein [Gemmataceae bacterium]
MWPTFWRNCESFCQRNAFWLGARLPSTLDQLVTCLVVCCILFFLALFLPPLLALPVVLLSLWLLISVYLTWDANERRRSRIAKKIEENCLREMPDLRWLALLVFVLLPVFLLLLFGKMQSAFGLFQVSEAREPNIRDLVWFFLDKTYLRLLPDMLDLALIRFENVHGGMLDYHPSWLGWPGRILVLLTYALIAYVVIQGLTRWMQIWRDLDEAIVGVAVDPDMAVRLGQRAVRPLLRVWARPEEILEKQQFIHQTQLPPEQKAERLHTIRLHTVIALSRIGDPRAIPILREAAQFKDATPHREDAVREAALEGLAHFPDDESNVIFLEKILQERMESTAARSAAAVALGRMNSERALRFLIQMQSELFEKKRNNEPPRVQKKIVAALGEFLRRHRERGVQTQHWVEQILPLLIDQRAMVLDHPMMRVRNAAARTLADLADPRGVEPIVKRLQSRKDDPAMANNPILIHDTIEALGRLVATLGFKSPYAYDRRAVLQVLKECSTETNEKVVQAAIKALGMAHASEERNFLKQRLEQALRKGIEFQCNSLKEALTQIDPTSRDQWEKWESTIGPRASQRRCRILLDTQTALEQRIAAAGELGVYRDERGVKALEKILQDEQTPDELKQACQSALREIQAAYAAN